jgi:hypothetical protein
VKKLLLNQLNLLAVIEVLAAMIETKMTINDTVTQEKRLKTD